MINRLEYLQHVRFFFIWKLGKGKCFPTLVAIGQWVFEANCILGSAYDSGAHSSLLLPFI